MRNVLNPAVETLDRAELEALQLFRLNAQLARCRQDIAFYQDRYASLGDDGFRSMQEFRDLVPFTRKADFVAGMPESTGRLAAEVAAFEYHLTSGTTGLGQETHVLSEYDHEALATGWQYQAHWAGLRVGDKICFTWPIGLQTGGLSTGITVQRLGLVGIQLAPYSSADKLRYMTRFQPQALVASPSYITHLTYLLEAQGTTPATAFPQMKALFIAGESYPLTFAVETQEKWGCLVSEWYGLMQGGMNQAFSCELGVAPEQRRGTLHNLDHRILAELLDPQTDEPVGPGETGEMVITTLTRDAFPIMRFKTNDRLRLSIEPCPCGRQSVSFEAGTVARYDDMMKVRGQNLWPEAVDKVVLSHAMVAEYVGEISLDQQGRESVNVRVEFIGEPESEAHAGQVLADLQRDIKSSTNVTMHIERAEHGSLPRFEFKTRRWTDRRRDDRDAVRYVSRS